MERSDEARREDALYTELSKIRNQCKKFQAENAKLKADLERALRDVDMFEKLANESKI